MQTVSGAVVTVAVDLDGSRMSVGTGVIFHRGRICSHQPSCGGRRAGMHRAAGGRPFLRCQIHAPGDADYDLAVIRMRGRGHACPRRQFGDSDALAVGDPVYAIGTPLDLELYGTFTNGIISAVERDIQLSDHDHER